MEKTPLKTIPESFEKNDLEKKREGKAGLHIR